MIRSLVLLSVLLFTNCASSFESRLVRHNKATPSFLFQGKHSRSFTSIGASGNDDKSDPDLSTADQNSDDDAGTQEVQTTKPTSTRIGGRRKRSRQDTTKVPAEADSSRNNRIASILSKFRTPTLVFLVLLLVKGFFSGGETSTYYYSYESTVYETRSYVSDGEVKTSRSESRSFKSNIPGMDQRSLYFDNFDEQ
ncbi:unnamed protein product [Cylindrotheca closterium]|uniref:Uncharacterized protein n=1 Tax=Cylindrotheca closterium TaxID=2856 RepID=A0AAD2PXE8_9STRA|nr:unnamed protein product [Cylindrotheca closterium]